MPEIRAQSVGSSYMSSIKANQISTTVVPSQKGSRFPTTIVQGYVSFWECGRSGLQRLVYAPGQCCWSRHQSTVDDLEPQQFDWDDSVKVDDQSRRIEWINMEFLELRMWFQSNISAESHLLLCIVGGVTFRPKISNSPYLHPSLGWWLNHPAQVKLDHPRKRRGEQTKKLKPQPRSLNLEGFDFFSPELCSLETSSNRMLFCRSAVAFNFSQDSSTLTSTAGADAPQDGIWEG